MRNLFSAPPPGPHEAVDILIRTGLFTLERIVSSGQATPLGEWYDQDTDEWVVLLRGGAGILFEREQEVRALKPGDYMLIPAHTRHRVEWTDPGMQTFWIALHFNKRDCTGSG